ncbi:MAG TPA: D-alanyl-D-alanine carboxypeptidase/D-alanyl-D-alanine-endopeptidase [Pyrinomonadaceae bacterium]|jgi:D-alanyl-D-alanine carboxypeptidase/D-alanyl-D-alanine-endopeptidase (penicillin-binding protein 4)
MKKTFLIYLLVLAVFSASCSSAILTTKTEEGGSANVSDVTPQSSETATEFSARFSAEKIPLPKAIEVSGALKDVELAQRIDEIIEKSEFRNSRWGVFVTSLKDGRVLVARDAQKTFTPASTMKVVTTAVALDRLGADFRWRTSVMAEREIDASGNLNSDLILYGRGAPDFDEPDVQSLINQLKEKGLRRVAGNIVGDASGFQAANLGAGWVWEEAQWYYGAEPSALSYSDNTVLVEVLPSDKLDAPAEVKTTPEADFIKVSNKAMTRANASAQTFGVHRDLDANNFQVWGEVPRGKSMGVRTTMHEPEIWAANDLKKALQKAGITVEGTVKSVNWRTKEPDAAANLRELAAVESEPLAEIVKRTNKRSINLNAELMLRTIGRRARENEEKENSRKIVLGDDELGAMTIKNWLSGKGVELGDTVIHDGSGLSRLNFITPETMGRLLVFALQSPARNAFIDSLPIAGTDGTLGGRLPRFKGRIVAKTGSITYVNALAGYAQASNDEQFSFVIFCNNETRPSEPTGIIDRIAGAIAEYPNWKNDDANSNVNSSSNSQPNSNSGEANKNKSFLH